MNSRGVTAEHQGMTRRTRTWRDPPDANSRRQGRSGSLGQVTVWWRPVGGVRGRWRCCTCVLYGGQQLVLNGLADVGVIHLTTGH